MLGEEKIIDIVSEIKQPDLWSVEIPVLYTAETRIKNGDEVISENTVRFGIRTFHFDADKGFFLNGKNMKIKGVCLHHDAGIVGTAMIRDVWYRRLKTLKEEDVTPSAFRTIRERMSFCLCAMR